MLSAILLHAADRPGFEVPKIPCAYPAVDTHHAKPNDAQAALMLHFIDGRHLTDEGFGGSFGSLLFSGMLESHTDRYSPCKWKGVLCSSGTIRTIRIHKANLGIALACIDMDWLPPTAMFVGLSALQTPYGWLTERLPRELVHLSLKNVRAFSANITREIDLRRLPPKMEELQLLSGWWAGALFIDMLPPSMRYIEIMNVAIRKVHVLFETLPEKFQKISVGYGRVESLVQILAMGKVKSDARVTTGITSFQWKYLNYVHQYA